MRPACICRSEGALRVLGYDGCGQGHERDVEGLPLVLEGAVRDARGEERDYVARSRSKASRLTATLTLRGFFRVNRELASACSVTSS